MLGSIDYVKESVISQLQNLEDYLQIQLDDVEMTEYNSAAEKPPLNFDEDSCDDEQCDVLSMKFDKQASANGNAKGIQSEDESVP